MEDQLPSIPEFKYRSGTKTFLIAFYLDLLRANINNLLVSYNNYTLQSKSISSSKSKNLFVQGKKLKKNPGSIVDVGFEYDKDVLNDEDFFRKIIQQNNDNPSEQNLIDYYMEIKRMMESYDDQDRRNLGALIGMTLLSLLGFSPYSFTVVGGITDGVIGGTIGRYAGKKLRKKLKRRDGLTQEELYRVKLQCMVKLAKLQKAQLKHNLNKFRTLLEKIIEESTFGFRFSLFQEPEKTLITVLKLRTFLLTVPAQKAILLTYKLFKMHFKQVTFEDPQGVQEAADKLNKVLIPYTKLIEIDAKTDSKTLKKLTNLVTYRKIKNLMLKPEIIQILQRYPDPRASQEYIEKFKAFMREKVDIEAQIKENQRRLPQVIAQLQTPQINEEPIEERVERVQIMNDMTNQLKAGSRPSEDLHPDEVDEQCMKLQKENIRSLQIPQNKNKMLDEACFDFDSMLYQIGCPKKQGISEMLRPKSPHSAHLECPSSDAFEPGKQIIDNDDDDSSSETEDKAQDALEEEKLEDDPELYIDLDKANGMSVSEPRKRLNINVSPQKTIVNKEDVIREIMEGASPTRGRGDRFPTNKLEPISLNNLDIDTDIRPSDAMKLNTYTNVEGEFQSSQNQNTKKDDVLMGTKTQSRTVKEGIEPNLSAGLLAKKHVSKTKKEMIFEKILAIAYDEESKWDKVCANSIIRIQKIKPEDSPVILLRAWAFLEGITPKEVFDHIYDTTARAKWDNVLADLTVVEKIDYETEVIHFVIKTPFGITERDFVQRRQFQHDYPEKGTITMSFQSTTHPARPPVKNRIRAETHIAGYVIKPSAQDPNSTDMCILSQVDIKGNIPKVIVNMVSGRAPADWVNKLKKACESDRKKK